MTCLPLAYDGVMLLLAFYNAANLQCVVNIYADCPAARGIHAMAAFTSAI